MSADSATSETGKKSGWLDLIERVGNRLPHPMTLFIVGTLFNYLEAALLLQLLQTRLLEKLFASCAKLVLLAPRGLLKNQLKKKKLTFTCSATQYFSFNDKMNVVP